MPRANARGFARAIDSRQRATHMIVARVDGTGTAALLSGSNELTLTDNGTGDYTLTYSTAYKQVPVIMCQSKTTGVLCEVAASSATSCQINCFDVATGAAATDCDFDIMILGSDAEDEV